MRILVIEDDPDIATFVKIGFENEGFIVDTVDDGEKGSYQARTYDYDMIILDLNLPKKSGYEVCSEIREAGIRTPLIMLSAVNDTFEKVRLLNCGADDYLTKPFSFHELLARARALLRRPSSLESEVLVIDDLKLDKVRQRVTRGKQIIYLTRKEFSLLEYLMLHQGIVVSRGMIMEHVWNADSDPFSNTIEAHILNIRKKVDTVKTKKLIHTIPGRGYKIESQKQNKV